jgi:hypothetical protein
MTPELKSLIEASVVNGQVDANARKIILAKANQQGINEDECDLFIASVIRAHEGQQKAIKADVNYRAYSLIAIALVEFAYAASIGQYSNPGPTFGLAILTGIIFLLLGIYLLGFKLMNYIKLFKRCGIICLTGYVAFIPAMLFALALPKFDNQILITIASIIGFIVLLMTLILWYILIVIFRVKIFGNSLIDKYPIISAGSTLIDERRKRIINKDAVNKFLETEL